MQGSREIREGWSAMLFPSDGITEVGNRIGRSPGEVAGDSQGWDDGLEQGTWSG